MDRGALMLKIRNKAPILLTPLGRDQFDANGNRLNFELDVAGRIRQFGLDAGRVTNIHFVKKG
jgi:hypothetical protein